MAAEELINQHKKRVAELATTPEGRIAAFVENRIANVHICVPAKVKKVRDRRIRQIIVSPLVKTLTDKGGFKIPQDVPCQLWQFAANGFVIDLPVREGDVGWLISSDFENANALATHKYAEMQSIETHKFSYGFFIPDFWGVLGAYDTKDRPNEDTVPPWGLPDMSFPGWMNANPKTEDVDADEVKKNNPLGGEDGRLVISTFDGKQKISIGKMDINITASAVNVKAGEMGIECDGNLKIKAPQVFVDGNLRVKNAASGSVANFNTATVTDGVPTAIN